MSDPVNSTERREHYLADWLALHELDAVECGRILDDMADDLPEGDGVHPPSDAAYQAPELKAAWQSTIEAMREFLPERRDMIDDTFEHTDKIAVDREKSRKALTLDNGPTSYPTILFSYRGEPIDCLVMAHEFGHALQIRASGGKFIPPIMRETCAFLGEGALLSHAMHRDAARYPHLAAAWRKDSDRYFGAQRERLRAALAAPATPYRYAWNYPIARHLANRIARYGSRDWIWSVFSGEMTLPALLQALANSPE